MLRFFLLLLALLSGPVSAQIQPSGGAVAGGSGLVADYTLQGQGGVACFVPTGTAALQCNLLTLGASNQIDGSISVQVKGVVLNASTTDAANPAVILPTGVSRYIVSTVRLAHASADIHTGTIGVFTGAGATGATIAADQAITITATAADTNNNAQSLTISNPNIAWYNNTSLFVRVGTGVTGTVDVIITIIPLT